MRKEMASYSVQLPGAQHKCRPCSVVSDGDEVAGIAGRMTKQRTLPAKSHQEGAKGCGTPAPGEVHRGARSSRRVVQAPKHG